MFNELIINFIITLAIVVLITIVGIVYAIFSKWKIIKYLFLLIIPIVGFPVIFRCVYSYQYDRYNYHITSESYAKITDELSNKSLRPELAIDGSKYDLYHTSYEWYYRCHLKEVNFIKTINMKEGIYRIAFERTNKIDLNDIDRWVKIDMSNFTWDVKYESKINSNGSRIFILRNSITGDTCFYRNRF